VPGVRVVSPDGEGIMGWEKGDWGHPVSVDNTLKHVDPDKYDAIILPGGRINPDKLRTNREALNLIREFYDQKKVVAAICHAPWLLIEIGVAEDLDATSYQSVKTDLTNAGANWKDEGVVVDQESSPVVIQVILTPSAKRSPRKSPRAAILRALRREARFRQTQDFSLDLNSCLGPTSAGCRSRLLPSTGGLS
jgi:PfpI family intracellular protease